MPRRRSGAHKEQKTTENEDRSRRQHRDKSHGGSSVDRIDIVAKRHTHPRSPMVAQSSKNRVNHRSRSQYLTGNRPAYCKGDAFFSAQIS